MLSTFKVLEILQDIFNEVIHSVRTKDLVAMQSARKINLFLDAIGSEICDSDNINLTPVALALW